MKYSFTTKNNQRVVLDRSIFSGKVKVFIDNKQVGSSHQGTRGAAGTFYPIDRGTLEIRSSLLELVPRVWYNEDWVDLIAPLKLPHYLLIALPFFSTLAFSSLSPIVGLIIGALGTFINALIMHSQRSVSTRMLISVAVIILTPIVAIASAFALTVLFGGTQP